MSPRGGVPASSVGPLLSRGRTAEVFVWKPGQVLKLFYGWCPEHLVQAERTCSRVLATLDLPVPAPIEFVTIGDRRGIVYERVDGISMLRAMSNKPWILMRMARCLAELHARIHEHEGAGLPCLHASLTETIQGVERMPSDIKAGVLGLLAGLPEGSALCHFDFHPDQVVLTHAGPFILDWMTARRGHPMADVARSAVILSLGCMPDESLVMRMLGKRFRQRFHRTYVHRYLELHPERTEQELRTWMVPVAAGRLREEIPGERVRLLAFIEGTLQEGLAARGMDGWRSRS